MKVILTQPVEALGAKGDVVDVSDGYARNYLVPRKFAVKASPGALRQAEEMRIARIEAERQALESAQALGTALSQTRVVVAARAGDAGNLFGSIGATDIVAAVGKFTGIEIDKSMVVIDRPIKEIGLHEVTLRPHAEVEVSITLDVIPA